MDIVSRLKKYISHLQMPVTQFADTANIPRPTFSQLLNGRNKKVSDELIGKIHVAFPELNIMWLLFGENEMLDKETNLRASNSPQFRPNSPPVQQNERQDVRTSPADAIEFDDRFSSEVIEMSSTVEDTLTDDNNELDKHVDDLSPDEFDFGGIGSERSSEASGINFESETQNTPLTHNPARKIVNIIVYYSDNSFESFTPDLAGKFIAPLTDQ